MDPQKYPDIKWEPGSKLDWSKFKGGKPKDTKPEFRITQSGKTWDLSKINFEKLKEDFQQTRHKNIEIADGYLKEVEQELAQPGTTVDSQASRHRTELERQIAEARARLARIGK